MTDKGDSDHQDGSSCGAEQQATAHEHAVGQTVPENLINSFKDAVALAEPHPSYKSHADVPFIFEILEFEDWDDLVLPLALAWIENPTNLQRVVAAVHRSADFTSAKDLICGRCVFRLKERQGKSWKTPKEHGLQVHLEHPETVVFLAVEDLGPENGFFMPLKSGQDVCVDGKANILFPATGGGRGICLNLKI